MEDKEKKILAITQDLSDCLEYDIENSGFVDTYDTACNLVDKGWVKLPEDSVVISREQWEDYKKYVDKCNEEYYRGQHEAEVYYKYIQIPKERKETAEKFVKEIEKGISKYTTNIDIPLPFSDNAFINTKIIPVEKFFNFINSLAKQFGVEIKEN